MKPIHGAIVVTALSLPLSWVLGGEPVSAACVLTVIACGRCLPYRHKLQILGRRPSGS